VAYTGLNTPMQVISPSSIAMTSTSPAGPGPTKASPTGQHARSVPAVSMTLCRPNRATSRPAIRETELDVVTLLAAETAIAAVRSGTIDATFRAVTVPGRHLPDGVKAARVLDEPHQLLTGPAHELASARAVTPAQLAGHRIWIPGIAAGTEWAAYYEELAAAFGLTIDAVGPNFGTESLLDVLADVAELASLVGEQTRLLWPADYGLRRIAVRDPTPVYPHSLIWRSDNPHPALTALRRYLGSVRPGRRDAGTWTPSWARPG